MGDGGNNDNGVTRRKLFDLVEKGTLTASAAVFLDGLIFPSLTTNAASIIPFSKNNLAERLSRRDPSVLSNSIFNTPPKTQTYPTFMRGNWNVTLRYSGYIFPSQKIPKSKLIKNPEIPGFQKCSIAMLPDVGQEVANYLLSIDEETGYEDRIQSFKTSIDGHLGYDAIQKVLYDNPIKKASNRISIIFYEYRTTNAERIELFCNGREDYFLSPSNLVDNNNNSSSSRSIFVCSEYLRQVTFSGGSQVGVPRQVVTNYAHFWTWKEEVSPLRMTGNLLTAVYLDPQDPMYFEEPTQPVVVYSHTFDAIRI